MQFAETLEKAMTDGKLSPINLASILDDEGCGVTVRTIEGWMAGQYEPRLSLALIVCRALSIDMNTIEPSLVQAAVNTL